MISVAEQNKRREAVEYAKASVELEGISLSKGLLDLADQYIKGLLSREEFTQEYIKAVRAGI